MSAKKISEDNSESELEKYFEPEIEKLAEEQERLVDAIEAGDAQEYVDDTYRQDIFCHKCVWCG